MNTIRTETYSGPDRRRGIQVHQGLLQPVRVLGRLHDKLTSVVAPVFLRSSQQPVSLRVKPESYRQ